MPLGWRQTKRGAPQECPRHSPRDALALMDGVAEGGRHSVDALSDLLGHRRSRLSYFNIQCRHSLAAILATSFWGSVISERQGNVTRQRASLRLGS
jgi:hypothetical protein